MTDDRNKFYGQLKRKLIFLGHFLTLYFNTQVMKNGVINLFICVILELWWIKVLFHKAL